MTTVLSKCKFKYNIFNTLQEEDIDFGATPDRTNKSITLKCTTLESEIKQESVGGKFYTIMAPVAIDIYQRMRVSAGLREEPQNLIQVEKRLVNLCAINRLSLQQYGINHMTIRSIHTTLDDTEEWYHTQIIVDMFYGMRG